jgi:branched-chain amino acid transport system substrate-binding protein
MPRPTAPAGAALSFAVLAALAAALSGPAAAQELRIGFLTNYSGPGALQGVHQRNGWALGLAHEGWAKDGDKLGGVPMKVVFGDDQAKTDVGLREVERMISSDKVHAVIGYLWSNVLLATKPTLVENKRIFISTVPGATPLGGKECSRWFIGMSHQNDSIPEMLGKLMSDEKIETVYALAPNYQAGRDMIGGFQRTFRGKIVDQSLFKVGETDYQAEISKLRAAKPQAVFIFAPGAMGIAFFKQWAASGAGRDIRLYSVFTVDHLTLPAIGDTALDTYHTSYWNLDSKSETNQRFLREYAAKFGHHPSMFAVPAYDTARMLAQAIRDVGGKVDDTAALARALRKAKFPSIRDGFALNVNGYPIQHVYKREVVRGADGKPAIRTAGVVAEFYKDTSWQDCPEGERH